MKNIFSFFIYSFLLLFLSSCSKDNKTILQDYVSSHNSHNVEKSLSFYSEDITFELVGTWVKSGKEKIKELEEWDSATNSNLSFQIVREYGDTLFCTGEEKNDWFTAVGIETINYSSIKFVFENQLIKKIVAEPNPEVNEKIGKVMGSIMEYTALTNSNVISELLPDGEFIYSKDSAEKWLKLLKAWNDDKSATK